MCAGRLCLTLILFFALPAVFATEVSGLYEAEVPVASQREGERNRALKDALIEVLIKVSGHRDINSAGALAPTLSNPMGLVQQFQYHELPPVDGRQSQADRGAKDQFTQVLSVSFDAQAVNQALNNAGLPVWGRARPSTLVWLAIEDKGERYLLGGDVHPEVQDVLKQEAQRRGVPVLIPLLDLEDESALRFADVWGGFQDVILDASRRYQAEAILVGKVYREFDNQWQARWSLYIKDDSQQWDATADQTMNILAAGIDGAADTLSARFSKIISETEYGDVRVLVTDVQSLEDYARAMKYLRSLDPVTRLQVEKVASSTVTFVVGIRSDRADLEQTIGFGSILSPVAPGAVPEQTGNDHPDSAAPGSQTMVTSHTLFYRLLK